MKLLGLQNPTADGHACDHIKTDLMMIYHKAGSSLMCSSANTTKYTCENI